MSYVLWIVASLIAYIIGVVMLLRVTPMLLRRRFDEGLFMGIAAMDIIGALLSFGSIVVMLALFNGAIGIRVLDVLLLIGILLVAARLSKLSLQPRMLSGTFRVSRIIAGSYTIFLVLAALYYILQMFVAR